MINFLNIACKKDKPNKEIIEFLLVIIIHFLQNNR